MAEQNEQYEQVIAAVLHVMQNDYAGQPECETRSNPLSLLEALGAAAGAGTLDDALFVRYVRQYLSGFQDPTLSFEVSSKADFTSVTCGFSVRRFGDELYVTAARDDKRLVPGDALVRLDGHTLDEYLTRLINNPVNGDDSERQLWNDVLPYCAHMQVRHADGAEEDLPVRTFPARGFRESLRAPTVEVVENVGPRGNELAAVITAHHFVDDSLLALLQERFADIQRADRVIIDVRDVTEGMIGNAYGLLALFFDREANLKDLMGEQFIYTRYTQLNAHLRQRQLKRLLDLSDAEGRAWVQAEIDHVAECAGAGFVKEAEFEEDMLFPPAPEHQRTFLLTDVSTSGVGERLAAIAARAAEAGCGNVQRVGRATRGSLDYSNLVSAVLTEKFSLVFPISKTEAAHEGNGTLGRGIAPDVYIPFTPAECAQDVVQQQALELP
ncbi:MULTISPECIES: hypothetical protein [Gordonibacter]|uniref:Tail specific protease domain-containing protein n=1 Tax=Gordonibacter faecis TaxID=3047475 RepID=A0ABT7DPX0_9ACTN|nr:MULTISPECIES: hypothetical protein [unclassified Gordonibacter]MDJ1650210.1 hypothetical protein [Gordonibacter sp. KGMB12511]HIW75956.1 hypothetical protein [Candidatus Gordonibacter avicola]